jgi:hypothetical protein
VPDYITMYRSLPASPFRYLSPCLTPTLASALLHPLTTASTAVSRAAVSLLLMSQMAASL